MKRFELIPILMFFLTGLVMYAFWSAEAFAEGDSNHTYQVIGFSSWMCGSFFFTYINKRRLLYFGLLVVIFMCIWYGVFDLILNHIRGKEIGYKTGKLWLKWLSLFIGIFVLPYIYFKI